MLVVLLIPMIKEYSTNKLKAHVEILVPGLLQAYSGAYKVQKEYYQAQSVVEEEAAAKQTLQKMVDDKDKAADILVKKCSSLEQASHSCYYVIRI